MDHNSQAPPHHHLNNHNHHHHLNNHNHHQYPPQSAPPPGMMLNTPNSYHHPHQNMSNNAPPQMIGVNSSPFLHNHRFPFNSTPESKPAPLEPLNPAFSSGGDGVGSSSGGFAIDPAKKRRGRPRKYSPDGGNIALGLAPTPVSTAVVPADSGGGTPPSETPGSSASKKHRGRPPGSGKRQLDALGNCGVGFTPHVILVQAGEDIASKIMAFSQQGPRTVCIMSANGSICNVTLRQSAMSDASVTYEGRFEIISLTGSFLVSESGGNQVKTGGMSISLAGPDGRVVGGGVAGMLVAATPVQIIVGSFVANGKKPKYMPSVPESRILHFGAPSSAVSPPSQEEASSESSEDNNANGHLNSTPGPFSHPAQQMHNMQQQQQHHHQQQQQMYPSMAWSNTGNSKMLHH